MSLYMLFVKLLSMHKQMRRSKGLEDFKTLRHLSGALPTRIRKAWPFRGGGGAGPAGRSGAARPAGENT